MTFEASRVHDKAVTFPGDFNAPAQIEPSAYVVLQHIGLTAQSCIGNAVLVPAKPPLMVLIAVKPIKKGDEITVNRRQVQCRVRDMDAVNRRTINFVSRGLLCLCRACQQQWGPKTIDDYEPKNLNREKVPCENFRDLIANRTAAISRERDQRDAADFDKLFEQYFEYHTDPFFMLYQCDVRNTNS